MPAVLARIIALDDFIVLLVTHATQSIYTAIHCNSCTISSTVLHVCNIPPAVCAHIVYFYRVL